jgi:hypothetical protein
MIRTKDVFHILRHDLPDLIGMFDKADHVSVDLAVQHYLKEQGDRSPIIYYRPRTEQEDHFSIGIQTESMRALLDEYSGNVVCMDTTHKCCTYHSYLLGTLLVLDSTGAGQPVAWFVVEGEKEEEMLPIFQVLQQRHPNLRPRYFMTDCADAFWNSWKSVFGQDTKRLWCKFHYWRAWSRHIGQVSDANRQRELREMLKKLVQAATKIDFDMLCFQFEKVMKHPDFTMKKKGEVVGVFGDYFHDHYMTKGSLWARFGRLDSDVSCNMHLKSFHRTLKMRYLKRVANQRLDFLIHRLIHKAAPDFCHKLQRSVLNAYCNMLLPYLHSFQIQMRGIDSTAQQRASEDHGKAKYLLDCPSLIEEVEDGQQWLVQSSTGQRLKYIVRRETDECPNQQCLV